MMTAVLPPSISILIEVTVMDLRIAIPPSLIAPAVAPGSAPALISRDVESHVRGVGAHGRQRGVRRRSRRDQAHVRAAKDAPPQRVQRMSAPPNNRRNG
jgi:hypothetical protein